MCVNNSMCMCAIAQSPPHSFVYSICQRVTMRFDAFNASPLNVHTTVLPQWLSSRNEQQHTTDTYTGTLLKRTNTVVHVAHIDTQTRKRNVWYMYLLYGRYVSRWADDEPWGERPKSRQIYDRPCKRTENKEVNNNDVNRRHLNIHMCMLHVRFDEKKYA